MIASGQVTPAYRQRIDRLLWVAALVHAGLCLAVGLTGQWQIAVGYAGLAMPAAWLVTRRWPGTVASGISMAALFMGWSAVLIEQSQGMIEAHFSIFIMLSALILYCDWRIIVAGAGVIAVHHVVFSYLQYQGDVHLYSVAGPAGQEVRYLLGCLAIHAGAVVAQAGVLSYLAQALRQVVSDSLLITDVAHQAQQGNLAAPLPPASQRRAAVEAMAGMQTRLCDVLTQANQAASVVNTLSQETAQTQQALHEQARLSADQVARIAASTEALSTTTRQSAAEADQTHSLARQTAHTVEQGAASVGRMSEAMCQIEASSDAITQLLDEIDDITFQTNLLALNASVEAARAGEQGRGFAVVASEVRNLSSRTADTAQRIRHKVQLSHRQVAQGVEEVTLASTLMQQVVTAFQQVSQRMEEISTGSQQQRHGIDTLNASIRAMQESLAIIASSLDQTQHTALTLEQQAQQLAKAISYFHLGEIATNADAPRQVPPRLASAAAPT